MPTESEANKLAVRNYVDAFNRDHASQMRQLGMEMK